MSKALINTNQRHRRKLALAVMAGGMVAGCGGNPGDGDGDGFDGLGETTFPLLQNFCTFAGTTMTLKVRTGETLYFTLRSDGKVLAGALTAGGAECTALATDKIAVIEDPAALGTEKVFLDYIGGNYALGTISGTTPTPGITLALGAGTGGVGSSVIVRGSPLADKIYLGSTYLTGTTTLAFNWINVNGDAAPDVRMTGVTDITVSTGPGADIVSADGGNGTTGTALHASVTFSAYGGADADILTGGKGPSLLYGGDGDDKFPQTATAGPDDINGGKGTDTVDYSTRLTPVTVTVCSFCSDDPSGCMASDTSCHDAADTDKGLCDTAADDAQQITCYGGATADKAECDTDADDAQTACHDTADFDKGVCDVLANDAFALCTSGTCDTTCVDACTVTRDDALDLCTQTHTDTYSLVCDGPHATALDDCSDDESDARDICDSLHTDALDLCSDNYADANSQCASDLTTCQGGITTVFCSVCTANDGAAGEHDTVNDDVEVVLGGKAGDTIDATYAACSNQATPTAVVKCTLTGNDGDDTIIGSPYADLIDGGAGNDTMQGGLGNDTFVGGAGNDTVSYADRTSAFPVWVSLDPAPAKLWAAGRNGAASELDVIPLDVEYLIGGAGDDKLRGNLNKNIIHGGAGDDLIEGGADIDSLYGDLGNDTIYGGAGNDLLFGGGGTDNLYGGDGDDFLDATDPTPTSDPAIDCDGVNELGGTSTSQGGFDTVVKDPGALIDTGALRCEKIL